MRMVPGNTFVGVDGISHAAVDGPQEIPQPDVRQALMQGWTIAHETVPGPSVNQDCVLVPRAVLEDLVGAAQRIADLLAAIKVS